MIIITQKGAEVEFDDSTPASQIAMELIEINQAPANLKPCEAGHHSISDIDKYASVEVLFFKQTVMK